MNAALEKKLNPPEWPQSFEEDGAAYLFDGPSGYVFCVCAYLVMNAPRPSEHPPVIKMHIAEKCGPVIRSQFMLLLIALILSPKEASVILVT